MRVHRSENTLRRRNRYDGQEEFYVVVRETGQREESLSYEELHKREKQAFYIYKHANHTMFYTCMSSPLVSTL